MLRKSAISLAIISALGAMQANALGLGEVKVSSALNQPLEAEIDLLQLRDLNASQVVTRLANTDDFYLAGVKPSPVLSDIRFKLDIQGGQGKIILTTSTPIREPFLNFLIEVNWPSGRLVREYTVLLDPPVFAASDLASRRQPVAPVSQLAAPVSSQQPSNKVSRSKSAAKGAKAAVGSNKYSVTNEDTLWQIAFKTRPDSSISPQQMMLAIQRANPDAFIKNNINRLKSGVVLDIPSKEQILSFTTQESLQEVNRQNSSWKGAPATVTTPKAAKLDATKTEMDAGSSSVVEDAQLRIVSKVESEAPASAAGPSAVATETSAIDAQESSQVEEISAKNDELEEQLVVTLEGLNKVERDNVEMFDRLDRLSEQMESMERLVELKDQQLAELQQQLAQKQAEPVVPASEQASIAKLPFEWIAGAAAALLASLAGVFLFMRKRKQDQEVEEALEVLDRRDSVVEVPPGAAVTGGSEDVPDKVDEAAQADAFVEADPEDPFNTPTERRGPVDEFDSISDDELSSALGEDLDMDLKLDEPMIDDPEMAAFSNSLLDDDEFDLSTGFGDEEEDVVSAAFEADVGLDADLDALLAEDDFTGSEVGELGVDADTTVSEFAGFEADAGLEFDGDLDALLAEEDFAGSEEGELGVDADTTVSEFAGLEADADLEFDGDLDALLAESGFAEDESEQRAVGLESEGFDAAVAADASPSAFDDGLDDGFGSDLDDLLAEQGSQDPLFEDEDSTDGALEQMLEDHDKHAASTGIDQVALAADEDDIPDDDTLDALLRKAEGIGVELEPGVSEIDQGIDIEFEPIGALDEELVAAPEGEMRVDDLEVGELPGQVLEIGTAERESLEFELDAEQLASAEQAGLSLDDSVDGDADGFVFELDDVVDESLYSSNDKGLSDTGAKAQERSSLSLEDELDQADDAELEAELEQMLVSEDNALALQEADLDDEEVNYLDEADEVGTKLDLARAYIDMEDQGGARDILGEVLAEGSSEQVAEAKQLLESLNS